MNMGLPICEQVKVIVRCCTYNQRKYIKDSLKGFAMQKTNFPFICCVYDDASTDGEQEILRSWIEGHCNTEEIEVFDHPLTIVLMASDKNNKNCIYAIHLQKSNIHRKPAKEQLFNHWRQFAKYEALCEGDDYWIDSYKLQKQIDFLEAHPNYSMCCSNAVILEYDKELDWSIGKYDRDISPEEMILGGGLYVQTASLVYKKNIFVEKYPECARNCHVGDYPLQIYASLIGKVRWLSEKQVMYRYKSDNSWTITHNTISVEKKIMGWKSEIEMLRGLNIYSEYKYNEAFVEREKSFIYNLMLTNIEDFKILKIAFKETYNTISLKKKIIIILTYYNLKKMIDFYANIRIFLKLRLNHNSNQG